METLSRWSPGPEAQTYSCPSAHWTVQPSSDSALLGVCWFDFGFLPLATKASS